MVIVPFVFIVLNCFQLNVRNCGPVLHLLDKVSGVTFDNPSYNKGH
jgi:hypothetical protein